MSQLPETPGPEGRAGPFGTSGRRALLATSVLLLAVGVGAVAAIYLGQPRESADASATPTAMPVASAAPSNSPSPSAAPTAGPSTPSQTPAGAEVPTGPGEAVMSFLARCDAVPPVVVPATTVLEDGRVVWRTTDGTYLVRQLTPDSLADFRERVRSIGLFEQSATYELERLPGAEPPGRGVCLYGFTWSDGGGDAIEVSSVGWLGDEEEATFYQPAPERRMLDELAQQLMDPSAWYDDAGWMQPEAIPFEPDEYLVLATVMVPQLATAGAPDFEEVSWPFDAPPDEFGVEFGLSDPPTRCDIVDAEAAEVLAEELAGAGLEQFEARPLSGAGAGLPWAARGATVDFAFWVSLPDGRPGCASGGP